MDEVTQAQYLIDTHCHLNLIVNKNFNEPITAHQLQQAAVYIQQALATHVQKIINVGTSIIDTQNCIALAQKYPGLFVVAGLHPNDLSESWREEFSQLSALVEKSSEHHIVGIGETGLDLYRSQETLSRQIDAFKAHIELALAHNLAFVVHTRAAAEQTLRVLEEYKNNTKKFVIHCYPYDLTFANTIISWGGFLGIGGPVTYPKNNSLQEVVREIDLKHIVLETDAPYLPPQIIRGQQNTPAQIRTIAHEIARIKQTSFAEVARITSENANILFNLKS